MTDNPDEPGAANDLDDADDPMLDRALAAWTPLAPPADLADRVLAARIATPPTPRRARRAIAITIAAAGLASAAALVLVLRPAHRASHGQVTADRRLTQALGDRGLAVAEPAT